MLRTILKIAGISLGFVFLFDKSIFYHLVDIIRNFGATLSVETLITSLLSLQQFVIFQQCSFIISLGYLLFQCSLLAAGMLGIILFVVAIIERVQPKVCDNVCNTAEVVVLGSDIYLYTSRFIC